MTKVSVVVPVYNPGRYLEPCVSSLLKQTMPPGDLEVVFVDDGSTDESAARLDALAAEHEHITVLHQENSGWPGQPRNRGIEASRGEYVFFCDHDDWFAPQALQRLHAFAVAAGSDVVLPKMGGINRAVPHHVFRSTVPSVRLADSSIMDSLTPHKLFRRAFLDAHRIRFPEGRRRLEDHLFVVTAYLLAETISIYGDYTCYTHIAREDEANAGFRAIDWQGYFDNLAEAVEVVEAHTEPGRDRDHIFGRWLRVEMVARVSGQRLLRREPENASQLITHASRVAAAHFGPGVLEFLAPLARPVGAALLAGDEAELRRLAQARAPWRAEPRLLQVGWAGPRLQIAGTVELTDVESGEEASAAPLGLGAEQRFEQLLADVPPQALTQGRSARLVLDLTDRRTGARWFVPAELHHRGLAASFTAEIDPAHLAAGGPLPRGLWDLHANFTIFGLGQRRRLTLTPERRPAEPSVPAEAKPLAAVYFAQKSSGLTLDVGLRHHPELRTPPVVPPPAPVQPAESGGPASRARPRWARRLRRVLQTTRGARG